MIDTGRGMKSKIKYLLLPVIALILITAYQKYKNSSLPVKKDYYDYLCSQTKKPFFREENSGKKRLVKPNRRYAWEFSFPAGKEAGKKRIFIIGESVSYILRTPNGIFDNSRAPEFINFSMSGYDSARVLGVFSESLKYDPDLAVIMSGNNETYGDLCSPSEYLRPAPDKTTALSRTLDSYGKNLERMAKLAGEKGVPLFICTLPVNLVYPPYGELPFDPVFLKAFKKYLSGDYPVSARFFRKYVENNPYEPFGNYFLGLVLREMKEYGKARFYLERAVSFDNRLDRAAPEKNALVRSLAGGNGVYLVDLEKYLSRLSAGGITDGTYLVDGVHWLDEEVKNSVQKLITGEIAAKTADPVLRSSLLALIREYSSPKKSAAPPGYEPLNYAVTYMGFNDSMDERIIYMLDYALGKGMISKKLDKEELSGMLRDNLWIKIRENPSLWWNRYLYYLSVVYLRKNDAVSALEVLRKADLSSLGSDYSDKYHLAYQLACAGTRCAAGEAEKINSYKFRDENCKTFFEIFSEK